MVAKHCNKNRKQTVHKKVQKSPLSLCYEVRRWVTAEGGAEVVVLEVAGVVVEEVAGVVAKEALRNHMAEAPKKVTQH